MNTIAGNERYTAYRDKRGIVEIHDKRTRGLFRIQDEDWSHFTAIVNTVDKHLARRGH